jgi:hypothetical protein
MSQSFFPTIGSVAAKADQLPEHTNYDSEQTKPSADDERPLHEIESLCMKCGEQVRHFHIAVCILERSPIVGYDSDAPNIHSILP